MEKTWQTFKRFKLIDVVECPSQSPNVNPIRGETSEVMFKDAKMIEIEHFCKKCFSI